MEKKFTKKELEILIDLVDEELGEAKKLFDETKEENIKKRLLLLDDVKQELISTPETKEIQLGVEIGKLSTNYSFKYIYDFLTHKANNCLYFDVLRNLYDKFDYSMVNGLIIQLGNKMYEVKENE